MKVLILLTTYWFFCAQDEDEQGASNGPTSPDGDHGLSPNFNRAGGRQHLFSLRSPSESFDVAQSYVYELSGIVIHSGQAHAGHYYSFIRDRGRMDP